MTWRRGPEFRARIGRKMALAPPAYRWRLVPVLTCAGFISGVYTTIVTANMSYGTVNPYPFAFFGSLSLGLMLCAVLWAFGFVPSRAAAATLVAATIAVHLIDVFAAIETRVVAPFLVDVELPVVGKVVLWQLVEHFLVALALYSVFLLVLVPGRPKRWTLLVSAVCAALTVVVVFSIVRVVDSLVVGSALLSFPAQTTQACFLAVALALAGVETRTPPKRFALVYVQLGYFLAVFAGTVLFVQRPRQVAVARAEEEIATRSANAPSRDNLPPLNEDRVDRVFLMEGVGEWRPYYPGSRRMPADQAGGATFAPRPERIWYYVGYSRITARPDDFPVRVSVTQYPSPEWARFDVLNSKGGRAGLLRLSQFGHTYYQDGPYFSWSSGDRLILLECECMPPVVDEFLKAYLAKYPSDL
jgi:hypothetical protein